MILWMTNSEECIIWYIQTRLAWQSSTWNPCGRVQMEQSGTSWMVSLFDHFLIDNLLHMDLCIAHGPWYFSFTAGTVFREPILCKNVPRLVPGTYNSYLIVFIFSNFFLWFHLYILIDYSTRLDQTHMHWKTCFWRSIQGNWCSYQRTWEAETGVW